jgi:hypothetical protein
MSRRKLLLPRAQPSGPARQTRRKKYRQQWPAAIIRDLDQPVPPVRSIFVVTGRLFDEKDGILVSFPEVRKLLSFNVVSPAAFVYEVEEETGHRYHPAQPRCRY